MAAGRLLRQLQRQPVRCACGHADHQHHERGYGNPGHEVGRFYCDVCDCTRYAPKGAERRPNVATTTPDLYAGAIKLKKEQWQPAVFAEGQDEPVQTAQAVRTKKEAESLAINLLDAVQAANRGGTAQAPATVTPLTADEVEAMEARGETIYRVRSGEAFATRAARRTFRKQSS